jgi:type II secretory pathway pseudopilin PulG
MAKRACLVTPYSTLVSTSKIVNKKVSNQRGFSILQLLMTIAIVGIVTVFAFMGISSARETIRLQGSVRQLAGYMEKARLDAIRRHDTASVIFTSPSTYTVKMDFDGTGDPKPRTFSFDSGVFISSISLPSVAFNWRGRTTACTIQFTVQNVPGRQSWVEVSDAGDVTVDNNVGDLPSASYNSVNTNSDIVSTSVVSGSTVHPNTVDCSTTPTGTSTPITGTGPGGCKLTASASSLTVRKNGGGTATVTISATNAGLVTVSGPINLKITPASANLSAGGSATFSIQSTNNTKSTFAVNFSSSCTTITVAVKITN